MNLLDNNIIDLDNINKAHFIGIGGIGMSALAFTLIGKGKRVSGSDVKNSAITEKLKYYGADVFIGHNQGNIARDVDLIVVSTAIDKSNPELAEAIQRNIPVYHRSDLLNAFLRKFESVAVTGTHGKTSTSAMMSLVLSEAKFNPAALVGGHIIQFDSNMLPGEGSKYLVAEVDESDQSIHKLSANYAIITNLEADHLDHYKDLDEIITVMKKFISNLPEDGKLIVCKDSYGNNRLLEDCSKQFITYSLIDEKANYRVTDVTLSKSGSRFKLLENGEFFGEFFIPISGIHYVSNAVAVIVTATLMGIDKETIKAALESYKGVKRRFEIIAEIEDTMIIDDYAHHPTEIKATLASASLYQRPVTVVFQPHRYSRTKALLDDFSKSFELADRIIITDIYSAGELQEKFQVTAADLVNMIKDNGKEAYYIKNLEDIPGFIYGNRLKNEIILTMGAGSITNLSKILNESFPLTRASEAVA